MARFILEIISISGRDWGGYCVQRWSDAVVGCLNQTGKSDSEASTFESHDAAEDALECIYESLDSEDDFRFRIREVSQ